MIGPLESLIKGNCFRIFGDFTGPYGPIRVRMGPYGPGPGQYEGETLQENHTFSLHTFFTEIVIFVIYAVICMVLVKNTTFVYQNMKIPAFINDKLSF